MINRIIQPVVHVLDPDAANVERLAAVLKEDGLDVRRYDSSETFLEDVSNEGPACLIVELELPRSSGLEIQRQLATRGIDIPILFFAGRASIAQCVAAIQAGAVDFIEKPAPVERLVKAVRSALDLHVFQQRLSVATQDLLSRIRSLTNRERETMQQLLDGKSIKQISAAFRIGGQTVAKHRARVLSKLKCRNDAQLIRLCLSHGIESIRAARPADREIERRTAVRTARVPRETWIPASAMSEPALVNHG